MRLSFSSRLFIAFAAVSTTAASRILVVHDDSPPSTSYSLFWQSLADRGFELVFRSPTESQPALHLFDEAAFDHLILFAPDSKTLPVDLNPQNLYAYVERAKNILVVVSPELSELWRDFAREFEVEFDDRGTRVIDHYHYDLLSDDGSHSALVVPLSSTFSPFVSSATRAGPPLLFNGIGHTTGRLPLLHNILHAEPTAYSFDTSSKTPAEDPFMTGSALSLVSVFQARNNARISFVGSLDLFSDIFAQASISSIDGSSFPTTGNIPFIEDLTKWTFQESGILRVEQVRHVLSADETTRELYKVRDNLTYQIEISSRDGQQWRPYNSEDLQLEYTMLDPHLRLVLSPAPTSSANSTTFSATFQTPDKHGVFTLGVDHRRAGWSFIAEKMVIAVTPPRHDEYDRFLIGALPYYGSAFSVLSVVLVFIIVWILQ